MKVLLEDGVWLTDGEGDPPRTTIEEKAKEFDSTKHALSALADARKYRPFRDAQLTEDFI